MTEPYIFWALIVGFVIGGAVAWFAIGRLPRSTDDVSAEERMAEAAWIASALAERGRNAPEALIEEVLELHGRYLAGPALPLDAEERDALRAARGKDVEASGTEAPPERQRQRQRR